MVKPTSDLDTEVLLSDVIGSRELSSSVWITTLQPITDGQIVIVIRPKRRLRGSIWNNLNHAIREWGGEWLSRERAWRYEVVK